MTNIIRLLRNGAGSSLSKPDEVEETTKVQKEPTQEEINNLKDIVRGYLWVDGQIVTLPSGSKERV